MILSSPTTYLGNVAVTMIAITSKASPTTIRVKTSVFRRPRVTSLTMRCDHPFKSCPCLGKLRAESASKIVFSRHRFEMVRIAAFSNPANMIKFKSGWHRALEDPIGDSVCGVGNTMPDCRYSSVSIRADASRPQPTACSRIDFDLCQQSLLDRDARVNSRHVFLRRSFRMGASAAARNAVFGSRTLAEAGRL